MQLDGALFEQIAAKLQVAAPPAETDCPDAQRRREPRVGADARVTIIPLTDRLASAPFDVALRDLSPGGIGFVHRDRVNLDEQFVVLLPHGRESAAVLCQVAYYQPVAKDSYSIGARFVRVLRRPAAEEAPALPLPQPAAPARRAAS